MQILSVSQLNDYLNAVFESDPVLADIWLEGEVANWSQSGAGHCYWTLRDGDVQLRAVCFRREAARQPRLPTNGEAVLVHGRVALYGSQVQIIVDLVRPAGIGLLHAQVEALKQRLEAEGLFARKRPLPGVPRRIGVVTSPTGAALRDILAVIGRRWPLCEVVLSPSAVQGEDAPMQLVDALYSLYELELDVIIVARGGGSLEDLWAFNDEAVARAVYAAPVPIVTGVGHETDTTVVDFVADLRAATPSVAAALVTPDIAAFQEMLAELGDRLVDAVQSRLARAQQAWQEQTARLARRSPAERLQRDRQTSEQLLLRLRRAATQHLKLRHSEFAIKQTQLATLNPRKTLQRGYAVVRRPNGQVITTVRAVDVDDPLLIDVSDGTIAAVVAEG